MEDVIISKISITNLLIWFFGYLILHILIGILLKHKKEELEVLNSDDIKKNEEMIKNKQELEKIVKYIQLLFNWFPAIVVIMIIISFYF